METRGMPVTDIDPFDSFAARLRVAQQRAKPVEPVDGDRPAQVNQPSPDSDAIGVRLRFRRHGAPRAGEPFEAHSDLQREVGKLEPDGSVRLRVPLGGQSLTVSVGTKRQFRVVLAINRD